MMIHSRTLCVAMLCLSFVCVTRSKAQDEDWQKKYAAKTAELVQKNGEGTDEALKTELLKMRDEDQEVRQRWIAAPADKQAGIGTEMEQLDKRFTTRLEEIVAAKGWPTIHLVGLKASGAAGLILIHSLDHEFQRKMLPQLQKLVDDDQIVGSDVALVTDKLLVAEGKPQRFGTQFGERNGKMVMGPVEDPEHLDRRREKYLLPPMAE
ncbi:MAG TPA: DUF6624 domain-containing protein, partial [Candidatus Angelobacter sp.]|nr:DUF6624 domain-containing protein [Candidatus Angelobacter sp.]